MAKQVVQANSRKPMRTTKVGSACFGSKRSPVRVWAPRPAGQLTVSFEFTGSTCFGVGRARPRPGVQKQVLLRTTTSEASSLSPPHRHARGLIAALEPPSGARYPLEKVQERGRREHRRHHRREAGEVLVPGHQVVDVSGLGQGDQVVRSALEVSFSIVMFVVVAVHPRPRASVQRSRSRRQPADQNAAAANCSKLRGGRPVTRLTSGVTLSSAPAAMTASSSASACANGSG